MTGKTNQERAKERAMASFARLGNVKDAAIESRVPISSLRDWLTAANIPFKEVPRHRDRVEPSRQPDRRVSATIVENLPRVDRDPCPRCNTRKDIGCKHFPKIVDHAPPSARERAEAMWSAQA